MRIILITLRNLLANPHRAEGWIGMDKIDDLNFRERYIEI
jgi:hypothetical protein